MADVPATVRKELARLSLGERVKPGQSVAITAGSRGIANIHLIIKAIVEHFQSAGREAVYRAGHGKPRRRHGRRPAAACWPATASPKSSCGCPIRATMETVVVCQTAEGFPVHFDRHAFEADHVVVVRPHQAAHDFVGDIESGLMKMMLIGLGKHEGAKIYHRAIQDYSFGQIVRSVAGQVLENCRIVAGVGDRRKRLRRNGPDRGRGARAISRAARKNCCCWPGSGCRGCRSIASIS